MYNHSSKVLSAENVLIINHNTLTFHHYDLLMQLRKNPEYSKLIKDKRVLDMDDMQLLGYLTSFNSSRSLLEIFSYPSDFNDYKKVLRNFYPKMNQCMTDLYIGINDIFSSKFMNGYVLKEKNDRPLNKLNNKFTIIESDDIFLLDTAMDIIKENKITAVIVDDVESIIQIAELTNNMSFMYPRFAYNLEYNDKYKTDIVKYSDRFDKLEMKHKHEYIEYEPFDSIDKSLLAMG